MCLEEATNPKFDWNHVIHQMSRPENISDFKCSSHHFQHVLPCSFVYIKTPETWPTHNYCYSVCVEAACVCHWPRFPSFRKQGLLVVFLIGCQAFWPVSIWRFTSVSPGHAFVRKLYTAGLASLGSKLDDHFLFPLSLKV